MIIAPFINSARAANFQPYIFASSHFSAEHKQRISKLHTARTKISYYSLCIFALCLIFGAWKRVWVRARVELSARLIFAWKRAIFSHRNRDGIFACTRTFPLCNFTSDVREKLDEMCWKWDGGKMGCMFRSPLFRWARYDRGWISEGFIRGSK